VRDIVEAEFEMEVLDGRADAALFVPGRNDNERSLSGTDIVD